MMSRASTSKGRPASIAATVDRLSFRELIAALRQRAIVRAEGVRAKALASALCAFRPRRPTRIWTGGLQAVGILTAEISAFCRDRLKVNRWGRPILGPHIARSRGIPIPTVVSKRTCRRGPE